MPKGIKPIDITKELKKTFAKAVMQHEAKSLKRAEEWKQARNITERGEAERRSFDNKYFSEYDTRIEVVRKRLINEAGKPKLNHPNPGRRDKFDREAIERQAHREVQLDHKRVLQQSLDKQGRKMNELQGKARKHNLRQQHKGKAKEQFTKASDRRKSPDRRAPSKSASKSQAQVQSKPQPRSKVKTQTRNRSR